MSLFLCQYLLYLSVLSAVNIYLCKTLVKLFLSVTAGKATTDEELEEMLEGGNSAVFTAGVRPAVCWSEVIVKQKYNNSMVPDPK